MGKLGDKRGLGRAAPALALAGLCLLALPAPASAAVETFRLRAGPYKMTNFNVLFPKEAVPAPRINGYLTDMNVRLVDRRGRPVPIRRVMLHHVLFKNTSRRGLPRSNCPQSNGESFYGTGNENQTLDLPKGYGYPVRRTDGWRMNVMLMGHSVRTQNVYVEYWGRIETRRRLRPVRPFWLSASGCDAGPSYGVQGGGGPGSTQTRVQSWRLPIGGRIVAAGGHSHGGNKDLYVRQPRCNGRKLFDHRPLYGNPGHPYYTTRPVLHEPSPINTRWFSSETGIRINPGERLDLVSLYDNSVPHTRVMGITHIYVYERPGRERRCSPIPADARQTRRVSRGRRSPPVFRVPLNLIGANGRVREVERPPGPIVERDGRSTTVDIRNFRFNPANLRIKAGSLIRWNFLDVEPHNVTFADGPRLISAPTRSRGATRIERFAVPGRYKLYCYLHPVTMHQVVDVEPRREEDPPPAPPTGEEGSPSGPDPEDETAF